eukprot:1155210-Pelagomonas_calceolata.AAC.2
MKVRHRHHPVRKSLQNLIKPVQSREGPPSPSAVPNPFCPFGLGFGFCHSSWKLVSSLKLPSCCCNDIERASSVLLPDLHLPCRVALNPYIDEQR